MLWRVLIAALGALAFVASTYAQSTPEERLRETFAVIKRHTEHYYPAITTATHLPDGVVIGFVVTRDLEVLDHSVAFDFPEGGTSADEVRRMFPRKKIAERTGGAGCFGGRRADEPKYCVVFAELEK
jgi:hypothetical protein